MKEINVVKKVSFSTVQPCIVVDRLSPDRDWRRKCRCHGLSCLFMALSWEVLFVAQCI